MMSRAEQPFVHDDRSARFVNTSLSRAKRRPPPSVVDYLKRSAAQGLITLVGDDRHFSLEHRLFNSINFLIGVSNLGGVVGAAGLDNGAFLVLLHVVTGVLFLLFYAASRLRGVFRPLYWPLVGTIAVFLFANTLGNAGSLGGAFLYFVPALVIAIVLAEQPGTAVAAALLFALLPPGVLFVERTWPDAVLAYSSPGERLFDVSGNFLFVQLFTAALVMILSRNLNVERAKSDGLLLNVLPATVAEELKRTDVVRPRHYESATVMFTDFVGFTGIAERLAPDRLVAELDHCFGEFDRIAVRHGLEKVKTIGDAYMAAGGIPAPNRTHAVDCVLAALEIVRFMAELRREREAAGEPCWDLRLGIHTGGLVAGVVGRRKFAYDVWGDTVNTASRLESSGVAGQVNVSGATYASVRDFFVCEHRGRVSAKGKGEIDMYFVVGLRPELSHGGFGVVPNDAFGALYRARG
jgi:adenylate cyclase